MSELATLPTTADPNLWSDDEKALLEAAGLVIRKSGKAPEPAPRPTVVAFLAHCHRTGLDPIAKQIYAIKRGANWGIQISIDGARLVAQRSGQYAGQTPVQWTADGLTWVDVWLQEGYPKAARVGVLRRGFEQPLYAVARWDSYVVMDDEWAGEYPNRKKTGNKTVSAMWAQMPDVMLAKVAEMLALRKAFPQDLSGLYSAEEMDQANPPSVDPEPRPRADASLTPGTRSAQRDLFTHDDAADAAASPTEPGDAAPVEMTQCERCGETGEHDGPLCDVCVAEVEAEMNA
ncbi:phage recombination protein Bet [Microbacterium sp. SORGH_AS 505]|uniref:phage recombination protein Bet n=1 Tax=Microbacterium sp. SORGH_AS_0505 TaxID=3041770 RepID=UPI0027812BE0|nr:phage recombination protein Bet [Microbacterium sp. SORGH_AS_0505]MDQ1127599.1 phage recombination protein Bet [Microbacterium sp. SORGH_AS_0505]